MIWFTTLVLVNDSPELAIYDALALIGYFCHLETTTGKAQPLLPHLSLNMHPFFYVYEQ